MTSDNQRAENEANEESLTAQESTEYTSDAADNAVSHGGRFGTDDTLPQARPDQSDTGEIAP